MNLSFPSMAADPFLPRVQEHHNRSDHEGGGGGGVEQQAGLPQERTVHQQEFIYPFPSTSPYYSSNKLLKNLYYDR